MERKYRTEYHDGRVYRTLYQGPSLCEAVKAARAQRVSEVAHVTQWDGGKILRPLASYWTDGLVSVNRSVYMPGRAW